MKKILLALCGAALASTALAHHSAVMFDHTKTFTVHGTVKGFEYTNPHSWLQVTVIGPEGRTVEWAFESEGPSTLMRSGIKPTTFRPGEKITVVAFPMRDGRPAGQLISATKADGTVYSTSPGGPAAAAGTKPQSSPP